MPPPTPSLGLRRFYSLFYTYCQLPTAALAHHIPQHHLRSFAIHTRARESNGYTIRRTNSRPGRVNRTGRGDVVDLRDLPIENSVDRPFDEIAPWDGAIRWNSDAGCMYEVCLPADALEILRQRSNSRKAPLLKKETGARVEVGETSERNCGRDKVASVLVSGSFDEVERVREVLRRVRSGGDVPAQTSKKQRAATPQPIRNERKENGHDQRLTGIHHREDGRRRAERRRNADRPAFAGLKTLPETTHPFAQMEPWRMLLRTNPSVRNDASPTILDFPIPISAIQRLQEVYRPDLSSLRTKKRTKCEISFPARPHPDNVQLVRLTGPDRAVKAMYDLIASLRPRLEDSTGKVPATFVMTRICQSFVSMPARGRRLKRHEMRAGRPAVIRRFEGDDLVAEIEVLVPTAAIEDLEDAAGKGLAELLLQDAQSSRLQHAEIWDGIYMTTLDLDRVNPSPFNPLVEKARRDCSTDIATRAVALRGGIVALARACFRLAQAMRRYVPQVERDLSEAFVPIDAALPGEMPIMNDWLVLWNKAVANQSTMSELRRELRAEDDGRSDSHASIPQPHQDDARLEIPPPSKSPGLYEPGTLPTPPTLTLHSPDPNLKQSIVLFPRSLSEYLAGHKGKNFFAVRKVSGVHTTVRAQSFAELQSKAGQGMVDVQLTNEEFERYGAAVLLKGGDEVTRREAAVMVGECVRFLRHDVVEWQTRDGSMESAVGEGGRSADEGEAGWERRWSDEEVGMGIGRNEEEIAARYFAADAEQNVDGELQPPPESSKEYGEEAAKAPLVTSQDSSTSEHQMIAEQQRLIRATAALPPSATTTTQHPSSQKARFVHAHLLLQPRATPARRAEILDLLIGPKGVWIRRIQWQSLCLFRWDSFGMCQATNGRLFVKARQREDIEEAARRLEQHLEMLAGEGWLKREEVEGTVVVEKIWEGDGGKGFGLDGAGEVVEEVDERKAFQSLDLQAATTSAAGSNSSIPTANTTPTNNLLPQNLDSKPTINPNAPKPSPLLIRDVPDIYPQTMTLETFNEGHVRVHYPDIPSINFQGALAGVKGRTRTRIEKASGISNNKVRITDAYVELRGAIKQVQDALALTREVIERAILLHDREIARPELWQTIYKEEVELLPGMEEAVRLQALEALVGKNWMVLERIKVKTRTSIWRGDGRFKMIIEARDKRELARARWELSRVVRDQVSKRTKEEGSGEVVILERRPKDVEGEGEGQEERIETSTQEIQGEDMSRDEGISAPPTQAPPATPLVRSSTDFLSTSSKPGLAFRPSPTLQDSYRPFLPARGELEIYSPLPSSSTSSEVVAPVPSASGNTTPLKSEDITLGSNPNVEQFAKVRLLPQSHQKARAALDQYLLADGARYIKRIEQQTNTFITKLRRQPAGEYMIQGSKQAIGRARKLLVSRTGIKVQMMRLPADETKRLLLDIRAGPRDEQEAEAQRAQSTAEDVKAVSRRLTHPVVLITSRMPASDPDGEGAKEGPVLQHCRGVTVSSFTTVTLTPLPIVTFNLKVPSRTWHAIEQSGRFCAHVMAATPEAAGITTAFTMPHERADKPFVQCIWMGARVEGLRNAPPKIKLPGSVLARLECWVMQDKCITVGDHVVVVAAVRWVAFPGEARDFSREEVLKKMEALEGLAYADRKYRRLGREIEAVKVPDSGSQELQAKRKATAQRKGAVEARARALELELLGGLPDEGEGLGLSAGRIEVEDEEYDFEFGPEDRKKLDEQVGDVTKPATPYIASRRSSGRREYHTSAVRRQQRDDGHRNTKSDPTVAHETLEQLLGETGTFRSRGRMRALIKAKRTAESASDELQSALADGSLTHERSLELENLIATNERRVDKKLALRAADELTRMLDTGRVDVRRAQWLESAVEKGMVVVRDEVERVKTAVEEKRLDAETFARVREGLSREWSVLSEAALRLREMSDVDSFDD